MRTFPIIHEPITLEDFYMQYLVDNKPCLFDQWITSKWPSRFQWTTEDGQINIDNVLGCHRSQLTKGQNVCVRDCSSLEFDSHVALEMSLEEYQKYWTDFHSSFDNRLLYLKDWHYFKNLSDPNAFYTLPEFFISDWMNEFWALRTDLNNDDFRFVYLGPQGTWTTLHADVYRSYSWSANIVGHKRWWFFPPGEENKLRIPKKGSIPVDVRDLALDELDVKYFVVDQNPGQIIFVPSNWYHQVVNLTDCLSINHNWFNACNVQAVWSHLQEQLMLIEQSTEDVRDTPGWYEECQLCLRALTGLNYFEFFIILKYILLSRWFMLNEENNKRIITPGSLVALDKTIDAELSKLYLEQLAEFKSTYKHLEKNWHPVTREEFGTVQNIPRWIYAHDLVQCVSCLRSFRENVVVQTLGLIPEDGPLKHLINTL